MTPPAKTETPRTDAVERNFGEMPGAMRRMERELTQWREVAGRLADVAKHIGWTSIGEGQVIRRAEDALAAYDALAKLSEKP